MARERYLIGVDVEELKKSHEPPRPMTTGEKIAKFWYNYKTAVIIGILVLALAVGAFALFASREKVDYTLVLVTKGVISDVNRELLAGEFEKYGEDLDGDGTVHVRVLPLSMDDPGDYVELANLFSTGNAVIFAMEPEYYQAQIAQLETADSHYFVKLSVSHPGLAENGRYWNWADSDTQQALGEGFPKDIYFGVREAVGTAAGKAKESEQGKALLEKVIAAAGVAEADVQEAE